MGRDVSSSDMREAMGMDVGENGVGVLRRMWGEVKPDGSRDGKRRLWRWDGWREGERRAWGLALQ